MLAVIRVTVVVATARVFVLRWFREAVEVAISRVPVSRRLHVGFAKRRSWLLTKLQVPFVRRVFNGAQ